MTDSDAMRLCTAIFLVRSPRATKPLFFRTSSSEAGAIEFSYPVACQEGTTLPMPGFVWTTGGVITPYIWAAIDIDWPAMLLTVCCIEVCCEDAGFDIERAIDRALMLCRAYGLDYAAFAAWVCRDTGA